MEESFLKAFADAIKEGVVTHREVSLEGLGKFTFSHRKQFQQQFEDGRVVMMPPKDTIGFTPDKKVEI